MRATRLTRTQQLILKDYGTKKMTSEEIKEALKQGLQIQLMNPWGGQWDDLNTPIKFYCNPEFYRIKDPNENK